MKKIGLIYWPKGGSVERCATMMFDKIENSDIEILALDDVNVSKISGYDLIILGGSTVGADHWEDARTENQWSYFFADLKNNNIDLKGKKVALFGLGNQVLYPSQFVDGINSLKKSIEAFGPEFIGSWSVNSYDFEESESIVGGRFVGLPLDEDTQSELTETRIEKWVKQLSEEYE
ncbi:MAG: flavodoxin domain-containing protein [Bacteroidota bacterium]|nr:flavodoxin domain-containing protein [Bacteroidota bacterium]MDP4204381.1 flavodoxin domain-containing protein [Bacteroidota bacterium]